MNYKVEITERLIKAVEVEAETPEEAEDIVRTRYKNEDYILTSDDFFDVDFGAKGIDGE